MKSKEKTFWNEEFMELQCNSWPELYESLPLKRKQWVGFDFKSSLRFEPNFERVNSSEGIKDFKNGRTFESHSKLNLIWKFGMLLSDWNSYSMLDSISLALYLKLLSMHHLSPTQSFYAMHVSYILIASGYGFYFGLMIPLFPMI